MIRNVKSSDYPEIKRILNQHNFSAPKGKVITQAIIEKNRKVIAYGAVRVIVEEVLILDKEISIRDKTEAIKQLHDRAIIDSQLAGFDEIHAFVQDENFEKVLKKHYGYEDCKGKAILMSWED